MQYTLLNRKVDYTGRVFDVAVHEYRLPDGRSQTTMSSSTSAL